MKDYYLTWKETTANGERERCSILSTKAKTLLLYLQPWGYEASEVKFWQCKNGIDKDITEKINKFIED